MNGKAITLLVLLSLLLAGCITVESPEPATSSYTAPVSSSRKWCDSGKCYTSTECEESFEYMFELVWELELTEDEEELFFAGVLLEDWDTYSYGDIVQVCTFGGYLD